MQIKELQQLSLDEERLFEFIQNDKTDDAVRLVNSGKVRVNCLDAHGMSPLDQAAFKGNTELALYLINQKADADNRAHEHGYTCLMFAALAGKPRLCQILLDAGARPHALNNLNKTASEMAAFVGQYECVSVISSYIGIEDIDRIVHPQGKNSDQQFPHSFVQFIHDLTKTHEMHPVSIVFKVTLHSEVMEHRKKLLYTVDRLFERQLRSKEPNELQSLKLWIVLFVLREVLKYVDGQATNNQTVEHHMTTFARNLLLMSESDLVRPNEERLIRSAIGAFPYKQSLVVQTLGKAVSNVQFGQRPSAYTLLCQSLFGQRFVMTGNFCATCGVASATKRCGKCKMSYCSLECQKFDWPIHKKCCESIRKRPKEGEQFQYVSAEDLQDALAQNSISDHSDGREDKKEQSDS
jgi:hypothetical protein